MNLRATQAEPEATPRAGPTKFTYPGGSRPLEGYTIKRGIGHGGFGEVYYAASDAGKEVALKLIRRNLDVEIRGVTQCLNLKHPNLLALYDIRQDTLGDSWVVMEYIAGDCLESVISRHPHGMLRDEALAWFHGIAAGVAYLHDHGIVHRDLKPGNIFCDEGVVKIGDYGLSKFISASRRSGQTESVGTVHYMAPEIGNGRYGKEIDIYALGIILYEMLTGHLPFEGESVGEVLMKHLTAEPNLAGVDEPFRSAIARSLAKDPEQRLRTVHDLLALLPAAPHSPTITRPSEFANPLPGIGAALQPAAAAASPAPASAAGPNGADVHLAEVVDEEPIARAVRDFWRQFVQNWKSNRIAMPAKVAIVIAAIALASYGLPVLTPIAGTALVFYAVYYGIRAVVLANGRSAARRPAVVVPPATVAAPRPVPPGSPMPPPAAPAPVAPSAARWETRRRRRAFANTRPYVPPRSVRERLQELTGSMLLAVPVAAVMCVVLGILRGAMPQPEQFAWLLLVGTLGSWLVLVPSKFWEGREGDPTLRRFVLLLCGLALGAAGWAAQELLLVDLPYQWAPDRPAFTENMVNVEFHAADGSPTLMGHIAYFAFLMLVPRWWLQADPARRVRLSVWSMLVMAFWAWVVWIFWPFPQPWGIMLAATISVAVQLASPWHDSRRRPTSIEA